MNKRNFLDLDDVIVDLDEVVAVDLAEGPYGPCISILLKNSERVYSNTDTDEKFLKLKNELLAKEK